MKKFEELEAWQKSRHLARYTYETTANSPFRKDPALRDQMRRAAVSISSNIAEGFERGGNRELANFLCIAKRSAGELLAQVHIAYDVGYITEAEFANLCTTIQETASLIGGLLRYLRTSSMKGPLRR